MSKGLIIKKYNLTSIRFNARVMDVIYDVIPRSCWRL